MSMVMSFLVSNSSTSVYAPSATSSRTPLRMGVNLHEHHLLLYHSATQTTSSRVPARPSSGNPATVALLSLSATSCDNLIRSRD